MFGERSDSCSTQRVNISRVKHGGGSVMLSGCFSSFRTGNLIRVKGIMKMEDYEKILKDNLRQSGTKMVWVNVLSSSMIATQSIPNFWCRTTSK